MLCEQVTIGLTREIQSGQLEPAAPLLRFMAELCAVKVMSYSSLASVYSQLVASPSDASIGLVLRTLPWAGRGLALHENGTLESVMAAVSAYLSSNARPRIPRMLCVMDDDDPVEDSYLLWALDQVDQLRTNDWNADPVVVPVASPHAVALERGSPHNVPLADIHLAPTLENEMQPRLLFRLFPRKESEKDLSGDSAERLVLEIYMIEAMRFFAGNLSLVVQRLVALPVRSGSEFILVETVLGQLLNLPRPELPPMFYHSLVDSLIKAAPRLQPLFERAFDILYQNIEHLDIECRERFVELMAAYLANNSFKWTWSDWKDVLTLPVDHHKSLFVRALLTRCVRLSYWARIEGVLPPEWPQALMPPPPKPALQPDEALLAIVKAGQKPQGEVSIESLVPVLLARGETFSLLKLVLRQYGGILRKLAATDEAKLAVLKQVGAYWADSDGHRLMVVDLLMSVMVVDHLSIVSWVFSEDSASLMSYSPWEILNMAFGKTVERTAMLRSKPEFAEKLEVQLREEKDLFLTAFQRFVIVMESYLAGNTADVNNAWFQVVLSQMVAFGRRYLESIKPFLSTLESVVFSDTDERIREAFVSNLIR